MYLEKNYHFHSAHRNTELQHDRCSSIHGHTYHLTVKLENDKKPGKSTGLLFREVDEYINPIIEVLDHSFIIMESDPLYDLLLPFGMRLYPMKVESSAENLAEHIFQLIEYTGLPVFEVRLRETTTSEVVYTKSRAV